MNQLVDRPIVPKDGKKPRRESATADEKVRYKLLKAMPCAACRKIGLYTMGCEIHHLTSGGRRIGNMATIPLCPFHHRAQLPTGFKNTTAAVDTLGPSLETSKEEFEQVFGSEKRLLAETNKLLGLNAKVEQK